MPDEQDRTEMPTSKRLGEAKNKGDVARSGEIDTAVFLLIILLFIKLGGGFVFAQMQYLLSSAFTHLNYEINIQNVTTLFQENLFRYFVIYIPFGVLVIVVAFVASYMQVGWLYTPDKLKPKWNNLITPGGLKTLVSVESLKNFLKGIVKLTVLSFIMYLTIKKEIANFMGLVDMTVPMIYAYLLKLVFKVLLNILIFYAVFAIGDYLWTKFLYIKRMKMTKSEVKDEFKQMEGDPQIKSKIHTLMMEESMKRMMKKVPEADVVITNPVHLAVALEYKPEMHTAPMVVAKGKNLIAERIKEIARENDIPIIENKPLARMLYKTSEVGQEIDVELYSAVAEILAQLYKDRKK